MNEEMRKEFEEFCEQQSIDPVNMLFRDGEYVNGEIDLAWMAWQASREAMKPIKLPDETDTCTCKSIEKEILYDGINYGIKLCKEAIESAGYKVAP